MYFRVLLVLLLLLISSSGWAPAQKTSGVAVQYPYNYAPLVSVGNQTAPIASTGIIAPLLGMFRVCAYAGLVTAGSAGTMQAIINYNDGISTKNVNLFDAVMDMTDTTKAGEGCVVIFGDGAPTHGINYSTTWSGVTGSPVYNLRINVERLNDQ